jgi:carboxylesterase
MSVYDDGTANEITMYQQLKYNLKKINIGNILLCLAFLAIPVFYFTGQLDGVYAATGMAGIIALLFINHAVSCRRKLAPGEHLRFFTKLGCTGIYEETLPVHHDPRKKMRHGVLLIHGFSASTSEFKRLYPALKKNEIMYYAPVLTGFGLEDAAELRSVKAEQWLRDVEKGYRLLAGMADEISIVAHSMGSMLALYLSSRYPVKHLVMTAPYLQAKTGQGIFTRLLSLPVISDVFMFLNPVLQKNTPADLEMIAKSGRFVYTAVPVESVQQLWRLPQFIDYAKVRAESYLTLVGDRDATIEIQTTIEKLRHAHPEWAIEHFPESGHNLLEDVDWQQAVDRIILELQSRT